MPGNERLSAAAGHASALLSLEQRIQTFPERVQRFLILDVESAHDCLVELLEVVVPMFRIRKHVGQIDSAHNVPVFLRRVGRVMVVLYCLDECVREVPLNCDTPAYLGVVESAGQVLKQLGRDVLLRTECFYLVYELLVVRREYDLAHVVQDTANVNVVQDFLLLAHIAGKVVGVERGPVAVVPKSLGLW